MTISTYANLKTAVASWANRDDLSDNIPDFIAWAHQEIGRRLRAPVLYARDDVTIDAETVSAPAGFLAAKRLYLDTDPRRILNLTDSAHLVEITAQFASVTYPTYFAVEGTSTLAFAPLFTGSATGKLLFYKAPDTLSDDDDTNTVLTKYPFLYLYGALEAMFRFLEDPDRMQQYGGLFGALIDSINTEESRDAMRGPLSASPSVGVVV